MLSLVKVDQYLYPGRYEGLTTDRSRSLLRIYLLWLCLLEREPRRDQPEGG
jgi:hypothetical protein